MSPSESPYITLIAMPHRQSDILLCYFAPDASDATDILVVCTGVRFSVGCISGTHCFKFSMCALYKYEIQVVNSSIYTGFLLLLGDGGGTREKIYRKFLLLCVLCCLTSTNDLVLYSRCIAS